MESAIKWLATTFIAFVCVIALLIWYFTWHDKMLESRPPPPRPMFCDEYRALGHGREAWQQSLAELDTFGNFVWFDSELNLILVIIRKDSNWTDRRIGNCTPKRVILNFGSGNREIIERTENKLIVFAAKGWLRREFPIVECTAKWLKREDPIWRDRDYRVCVFSRILDALEEKEREELCYFVSVQLRGCDPECP